MPDQFVAQFHIIVNLSVKHHREALALAQKGLTSDFSEIEDAQAAMSHRHALFIELGDTVRIAPQNWPFPSYKTHAEVVWSTMLQAMRHGFDQPGIKRAIGGLQVSNQSAHLFRHLF